MRNILVWQSIFVLSLQYPKQLQCNEKNRNVQVDIHFNVNRKFNTNNRKQVKKSSLRWVVSWEVVVMGMVALCLGNLCFNRTNLSFKDQCVHWTLNQHIKYVILMTFRNNNFNKTSLTLINKTRNIFFTLSWNIILCAEERAVNTCNSIKRAPQTVMNRPASISLKPNNKEKLEYCQEAHSYGQIIMWNWIELPLKLTLPLLSFPVNQMLVQVIQFFYFHLK